ncbi:MAG: peptidylprolyl isomerase [Thermodesulfovibrionales bacterium]
MITIFSRLFRGLLHAVSGGITRPLAASLLLAGLLLLPAGSSALAAPSPTLRLITVATRQEAADILDNVKKGGSFALLARERSLDKSGETYGEVGPDRRKLLPRQIRKALSSLAEGEVSRVIPLGKDRFAVIQHIDLSFFRRGAKEFRQADHRKAEKDLLQHIQLNPDAVKARLMLGEIYERRKEVSRAAGIYRDALLYDTDNREAKTRLARLAEKTGKALSSPVAAAGKPAGAEAPAILPDEKPGRKSVEEVAALPQKDTVPDRIPNRLPEQAIPVEKKIQPVEKKTEPAARHAETVLPRTKTMPPAGLVREISPLKVPEEISPPAKRSAVPLRIIVTDSQEKALDILAELRKGKPFFFLAHDRSIDKKSAEEYGYLGEVEPGSLHPDLQAALTGLKENRPSRIIKLDDARYAIILIRQNNFFHEAHRALLSKEYARAGLLLRRHLELNPDDLQAWLLLAGSCEAVKDHKGAEEAYGLAIAFRPKAAELYEGLGKLYLKRAEDEKAREAFRTGQKYVPSSGIFERLIEITDILLIGKGG